MAEPKATFLSLYEAHCGQTEVPPEFNLWAGLALISAAVSDRVWIEKYKGEFWTPNLYVLLLGPAELGKERAVETAKRLIPPGVTVYGGKETRELVAATIATRRVKRPSLGEIPTGAFFLVNPALSMDVGRGPGFRHETNDFVLDMLRIYDAPGKMPAWLAGTTIEWLLATVAYDAIECGFYAKAVCVEPIYDLKQRYAEPKYPADYRSIVAGLERCLEIISTVPSGEIPLTPGARRYLTEWYDGSDAPIDERQVPVWKHSYVLVHKIAMLMALSAWSVDYALWQDDGENGEPPKLEIDHLMAIAAEAILARDRATISRFLQVTSPTPTTTAGLLIEKWLSIELEMPFRVLMQRLGHLGFNKEAMKEGLAQLTKLGVIKTITRMTPRQTYRTTYIWLGRKFVNRVKGVTPEQELDPAESAATEDYSKTDESSGSDG